MSTPETYQHVSTLTCVHNREEGKRGLCPECAYWADFDPLGYEEFGDHVEGISRWEAEKLRQRQEADAAAEMRAVHAFDDHSTDDDIPF
jgi:hypothetical protein